MRHLISAGVGIVLLGLVAGIAWWQPSLRPAETGRPPERLSVPNATQIRQLQEQADAACRCDRRSPDVPWDQACWADFDRTIAMFEHWQTGSACMEESTSQVCFGQGVIPTPERCLFKERSYGACSAEEEQQRRTLAEASNEGCG